MRRRFAGCQVEDSDPPAFGDHFCNGATHAQFRVVGMRGDDQKIEPFIECDLARWIGMNDGSQAESQAQLRVFNKLLRVFNKLSTASTGMGMPRNVPSITMLLSTTP